MISWGYCSVLKHRYDQLGFSSSKPISVCYSISFAPTVRRPGCAPEGTCTASAAHSRHRKSQPIEIVYYRYHIQTQSPRLCPSSPHVPLRGRDKARGSQLKEPPVICDHQKKSPLCQIDDTVCVMWIMSGKSISSWLQRSEVRASSSRDALVNCILAPRRARMR